MLLAIDLIVRHTGVDLFDVSVAVTTRLRLKRMQSQTM
jgi:hypothetical protein